MKKADIWVSTVIYMLIGLSIISALLFAAKPKIEEARDRFVINYMINTFNSLDGFIREINEVPGMARYFDIKISKGEFKVIPENDTIEWKISTNFKFSEIGQELKVGNVNLISLEKMGRIETKIWLNYVEPINITTQPNNEGQNLTLTPSPNIYRIYIQNLGAPAGSVNNTIYISS